MSAVTGTGVTNAYALYVVNGSSAGNILNRNGLAIENQTGATNNTNLLVGTSTIPTGNFSIYNSSAYDNFFGGKMNIGSTSIGTTLGVIGNGYFSLGLGVTGNLKVGGSLVANGLMAGIGTSILYIDSTGNITQGTLPVTSVANSKTVVLSAEYAGASLSADGSGTTSVSMTSDNTLNAGGVGWKKGGGKGFLLFSWTGGGGATLSEAAMLCWK